MIHHNTILDYLAEKKKAIYWNPGTMALAETDNIARPLTQPPVASHVFMAIPF